MECIVIATVTYNSSCYLRRLVEYVAKQTYRVYKIVAVDNASSTEHRVKNEILAEEYPFLEVVRIEENLGGAGGFEKGIRYIFEQGYEFDWIWIMDDDAFPNDDCLEKLVAHKDLDNVGALVPIIYGVELGKYQLYHHKNESKYLNRDISVADSLDKLHDITRIETNAFVGPLVSKEVFEKVGFPDGKLFIYGDDTEFMYRVSRRYSVYLIKDAVINHRDVIEKQGTVNPRGFWKEYYKYRNRFLFIAEYKNSVLAGFIGKSMVISSLCVEIISTIKNRRYRNYRMIRLKCLLRALIDGLRNRKGKVLDPVEFVKSIDKN